MERWVWRVISSPFHFLFSEADKTSEEDETKTQHKYIIMTGLVLRQRMHTKGTEEKEIQILYILAF